MAISVKILRTSSAVTGNKFLVTADSGDTGRLQIQLNSSDVYNNLSGGTSDILSGASNTDIYIPLNEDGSIPKGEYYFNFVASVGTSDTSTISFQIDARTPSITPDVDVYAPIFRVDDDSNYIISNSTVSAATRSLTLQYPATSNQSNLSASTSDTTTSLYISTNNLWTGSMQTTLNYDVLYTIAATSSFDTFLYQEVGIGYNTVDIAADSELSDLYLCIENLREQVAAAATQKRTDYATLLSKYTYVCSLALQWREGIIANNTSNLTDIIAQIKALTNCAGSNTITSSQQSKKIFGIGGTSESIEDIVAGMFLNTVQYGIDVTYNESSGTLTLENRSLFLDVYNDTGSTIAKGKAVYITGYDATTGLPEISLATNLSASSSNAIGFTYTDIASATSGRALVSGFFQEVNTSGFSAGDVIYLSTSGDFTTTNPAPNGNSQLLGTVLSGGAAGEILVTPQAPQNLTTLLSSSTVITAITNNLNKATVTISEAGAVQDLDNTSLLGIAGIENEFIIIHSAIVYITNPPTTGSQSVNFTLMSDTASGAAYSAGKAIWETGGITSGVALTAGANSAFVFTPKVSETNPVVAHAGIGESITISNSDGGGTYTDWADTTVVLVIYYAKHRI